MEFLTGLVVAAAAISHISDGHLMRSDPVLVRAVISGDTIDVEAFGHVRLLGIDAPSVGGTKGRSRAAAPYGREARDRLAGLVLHRWVRLERDETGGRAVNTPGPISSRRRPAYLMTEEGTFVNALLVREGLARVSAQGSLSRLAELQRAEAEAKAARRGLWSATAGRRRPQVSETYRIPKPAK